MFAQWYSFRTHLVSEDLATKFVQFSEDDETKEFLENSREKSDQLFTQLFHSIVKFILSWAMNKTSINGYEIVLIVIVPISETLTSSLPMYHQLGTV